MEPFSTLDQSLPGTRPEAVTAELGSRPSEINREQAVQQNSSTRNPNGSVSAALGAVRADAVRAEAGGIFASSSVSPLKTAANVRFPGEDAGRSLAEMAQRDLDAALQLLADRAQYITGATGAAIALRRDGKKDMLCRASSGSNAPELGALLSTEFGLSGESVRTRQALRCDDAERDIRVNREVCRQMGIASVVVMPVVDDDEVLGVFELFSGRANAFGARDVSAVQRLSEMVETAVRLAQAAKTLPDRLKTQETSVPELPEDQVLEGEVLQDLVVQSSAAEEAILEEPSQTVDAEARKADLRKEDTSTTATPQALPHAAGTHSDIVQTVAHHLAGTAPVESGTPSSSAPSVQAPLPIAHEMPQPTASEQAKPVAETSPKPPAALVPPQAEASAVPSAVPPTPKKKLFWSAAENPAPASNTLEADRSHVPPVLRGLRKCDACGFPVSAGRALCVECEEKKWKGQLKTPRVPQPQATSFAPPAKQTGSGNSVANAFTAEKSSIAEVQAARQTGSDLQDTSIAAAGVSEQAVATPSIGSSQSVPKSVSSTESMAAEGQATGSESASVAPATVAPEAETRAPEFVLSAGLAPSQSWLAANKYVVGVLLAVATAILLVFVLR
jgi:GAF domain-containing protein